jgi:hypothetical protein
MTKCCVVGCRSEEEARLFTLLLTGKPVNLMKVRLCARHSIEAGLLENGN